MHREGESCFHKCIYCGAYSYACDSSLEAAKLAARVHKNCGPTHLQGTSPLTEEEKQRIADIDEAWSLIPGEILVINGESIAVKSDVSKEERVFTEDHPNSFPGEYYLRKKREEENHQGYLWMKNLGGAC